MMRIMFAGLLFLNSLLASATDLVTLTVNTHARQFTVKLPANPTTGYQWTVREYDKALLKLTDSSYLASHSGMIGAGGTMVYTFERLDGAVWPKSTTLLFSYARSWEPGSGRMEMIRVDFQ